MKGWFNQFPLPAESFRELTVKRLMFFKRLAVIFSPLNHKTLEEWLKLLLRPELWTWILELSRYIFNEIHRCFFAALQLEGFGWTLQQLTFSARVYLFIYACIGLIAVALSSVFLSVSSALHLHRDEKQNTKPKQGRGIVATCKFVLVR